MKKYILIILFVLTFSLTGCEFLDNSDTPSTPNCIDGYHVENGTCVIDEVEEPDNPVIIGDFDNENCTHLEAIGDWEPVWCDEFNYIGLPDDEKWSYDVGGNGWGNGELQYYTRNDEDNAYVDGENLTITAIKEAYSSNSYTSARLITKGTGDWLYGKIQVKAKLPSGKGTWPAIWMLPTEWKYGNWPNSGEIDIMEHVGYDPNNIHTTIHTGAYNHSLNTQIGYSKSGTTWETDFHVYEIEWEPGVIRSYVDGILYATFDYDPLDNTDVENYMAWPFDEEFHLLLNIAVGGAWGGAQGVDTDIWPQEMVVDYVRVYQKDYASMDQTAPEAVSSIDLYDIKTTTTYVKWDKAVDDVMVKEYKVYVDGTLYDTTTLNGILLTGLTPATTYTIKVVAVDFALNESLETNKQLTTASPQVVTSRVEAEDYETMVGIDTQSTSDSGGGENVGWTDSGDYLTYTLIVEESGNYVVDYRLSTPTSGGSLTLSEAGNFLANVSVSSTGGWQSWVTVSSDSFYISAGTYTFTITFNNKEINFNYFEFKKVD